MNVAFFLICYTATVCFCQTELSDAPRIGAIVLAPTHATDYHALWANPANLGFAPRAITYNLGSPMEYGLYRIERSWSIGLGEAGATFATDAMSFRELSTTILRYGQTQFDMARKQRAAKQFAGRSFAFNVDVQLIGIAYRSNWWGGVALGIRDRFSSYTHINSSIARFMFLGRYDSYFDSTTTNWRGDTVGYARQPRWYSELFDSTVITASWMREYAVGYGCKLYAQHSLQLWSGITVRLIEGFFLLNGKVRNHQLAAYSSISPFFNIDYGKATSPSMREGTGLIPVGSGVGVDLGFTLEVASRWRVGLAMLDIGSVRWNGNVFAIEDTVLNGLISTGLSSFDIIAEAQSIKGEGGYIKWRGIHSVTNQLPLRLRLGVSHSLGVDRDAGLEFTIPLIPGLPGASNLMIAGGVRYAIFSWVLVNGGLRLGTPSIWTLPMSVQFILWDGRCELGIATQDLASLVVIKYPTLSLSGVLLRIHL